MPEFIYIVKKILLDKILYDCDMYIDNIPVKRPKTIYNSKEALPGV